MYNKQVLSEALANLQKRKAQLTQPKDIIVDPMGQYNHPGKNTRIPGGDITMANVPYPVMAYPNIGQPVLMQPGGEYYFPGADYVDEYPMMKIGGPATYDDSLALRDNSIEVQNYYNNDRYKLTLTEDMKPDSPDALSSFKSMDEQAKGFDESKIRYTQHGLEALPISDYRRNVNDNVFYQREMGDLVLDTRAPMQRFDRRISPTGRRTYDNIEQDGPLKSDLIDYYTYDPLSVTPWGLLDESQKKERLKRFGTAGTPYAKVEDALKALKEKKEYKPNLNTDLAAWLKTQGAPASYADRKKLYEQATGQTDYKGTAEQNIGLLNLVKERGLDYKIDNLEKVPSNTSDETAFIKSLSKMPEYSEESTEAPITPLPVKEEPTVIRRQVPKTVWKQLPNGTWYPVTRAGNNASVEDTGVDIGGRTLKYGGLITGLTNTNGNLLMNKKGKRLMAQSGSLSATNELFLGNPLITKRKKAVYVPGHAFQDGGSIDLELTNDEIEQYKQGGYIVEELPKAQKGLFNFDPTPEYVGYQGDVPISESTRVANTYKPTQQEIKATKEYDQKVGATAQAIRNKTGVSHKEAMQQAEQVLQANSRVQPEAKAYANTKQAQERDAYVFDEGMNARDYFRYPLQFLAGNTPTQEERIQDRIRVTDPRTSNLDKFMGSVGEAIGLAPAALINTGVGLAFAPSNLSKLGMVADAVSPVGAPTNLFKGVRTQNDILLEQARRSGEAPLAGVKPGIDGTPDMPYGAYMNMNNSEKLEFINTVDNTIQTSGQRMLSELTSPEGKKRLIQQFKELDPSYTTEELEQLFINRVNSVKHSITDNRAKWIKVLHEMKEDQGVYAAEEFLRNLNLNEYFPYRNAHYSNQPLFKRDFSKLIKNQGLTGNIDNFNVPLKRDYERFEPTPGYITLGKGYERSPQTLSHEIGHAIQKGESLPIDRELRNLISSYKLGRGSKVKGLIDDSWRKIFSQSKDVENLQNNLEYFVKGSSGKEPYPFARELRESMLEDGKIGDIFEHLTKDKLTKFKNTQTGITGNNRLLYFVPPWDRKKLAKTLNKAPGLVPYLGAGYLGYEGLKSTEGNNTQEYQQGGSIDLKLTDDEIKWYQKGGYIVEEYSDGGIFGKSYNEKGPFINTDIGYDSRYSGIKAGAYFGKSFRDKDLGQHSVSGGLYGTKDGLGVAGRWDFKNPQGSLFRNKPYYASSQVNAGFDKTRGVYADGEAGLDFRLIDDKKTKATIGPRGGAYIHLPMSSTNLIDNPNFINVNFKEGTKPLANIFDVGSLTYGLQGNFQKDTGLGRFKASAGVYFDPVKGKRKEEQAILDDDKTITYTTTAGQEVTVPVNTGKLKFAPEFRGSVSWSPNLRTASQRKLARKIAEDKKEQERNKPRIGFKKGGYIVEELPKAQVGLNKRLTPQELIAAQRAQELQNKQAQYFRNNPVSPTDEFGNKLKVQGINAPIPTSMADAEGMIQRKEIIPESLASTRVKQARQAEERKQERIRLQEDYAKRQANPEYSSWTGLPGESWRETLAAEGAPMEAMFRVSNEDNFFDDYINPAAWIGFMAKALGEAPLQAQKTDSYLPYVTSIGIPLIGGALAGIGTKTTGQFVNNMANPFAGLGTGILNRVGRKSFTPYLDDIGSSLNPRTVANTPKQLPGSTNVDLRLWNIFNKKKTESFLPPSLNTEAELARANADALAFSQSPYNRAKLQEFRPGQDFNVTNTEALFHNDPVARERFAQLMKDDPDFLKYKNTENWQGAAEGNYGARNFGDINDLAIVNKNKPRKIYNAAIHETGHSRSVRLPATKEERAILDDAWKGLKEADGSSLSVLEGEAVQGELRMLLGDKLGKRVYTQKNAGEIKAALEKMIADNHPYMQNINDFNISKIIKSLNKIGLAGLVPATIATGVAASSNEYKQGGSIDLELTDEEIKWYQKGGYTVEEYQNGGEIISEHGWDYKKEGDKYFTKKVGTDKWIEPKGSALHAIQQKVFGDVEYTGEDNKLDYINNVQKLISSGYTLEDLVKQKVGTKQGLLNLFPELSGTTSTATNKTKEITEEPAEEVETVFTRRHPISLGLKSYNKASGFSTDVDAIKARAMQSLATSKAPTTMPTMPSWQEHTFAINEGIVKPEYTEAELTDEEIAELQAQGHIVEEVSEPEPWINNLLNNVSQQSLYNKTNTTLDPFGRKPKSGPSLEKMLMMQKIVKKDKGLKEWKPESVFSSATHYGVDAIKDVLDLGQTYFQRQDDKNNTEAEPKTKSISELKAKNSKLFNEDSQINEDSQSYNIDKPIIFGENIEIKNKRYNPTGRRVYRQEYIQLEDAKFGFRNRGEMQEIISKGGSVTAFYPFEVKKDIEKENKYPADATFIGISTDGSFKTGKIEEFKNTDRVSRVFTNLVDNFILEEDGSVKLEARNKDNPNSPVPVVTVIEKDPNGKLIKKEGSINVLTKKVKDARNQFGPIQGGRVILKGSDGKSVLVSGSLNNIHEQFKEIRERTGKPVEVIQLDNGSYNLGLATKDNKMTKEDLKAYDKLHTSGGNFLYIIDEPSSNNVKSAITQEQKDAAFTTINNARKFIAKTFENTPILKDVLGDIDITKNIPDYSRFVKSPTATNFREDVIIPEYKYGMSTDDLLIEKGYMGKGIGSDPYMDCSGAVCRVMTSLGKDLGNPLSTNAQTIHNKTKEIKEVNKWKDGDIITFNTEGSKIDHIGFLVIDENTGEKYIAESSRSFQEGRIVPFQQRLDYLYNVYPDMKYYIRRFE